MRRDGLRGLANDDREVAVAVEREDLDVQRRTRGAGLAAGRSDGAAARTGKPMEDFDRGSARERGVRAKERVPGKGRFDFGSGIVLGERWEEGWRKGRLERFPEPLYQGDGAVLADGAEALPGALAFQRFLEGLGSEAATLIGDEVSGFSERTAEAVEELGDIAAGGILAKQTPDEGRSGEGVVEGGEFEGRLAEGSRELSDIRHDGMKRLARGHDMVLLLWGLRPGRRSSRGFGEGFTQDPADGGTRDLESGGAEERSDLSGTAEVESGEELDDRAEGIAVTRGGRDGCEEGADRLGTGVFPGLGAPA